MFYTIRFLRKGSNISVDDLPTPCRVEPLAPQVPPPPPPVEDSTQGLTLGLSLGIPLAIFIVCLCYMVKREKQGTPIFLSIVTPEELQNANTVQMAARPRVV